MLIKDEFYISGANGHALFLKQQRWQEKQWRLVDKHLHSALSVAVELFPGYLPGAIEQMKGVLDSWIREWKLKKCRAGTETPPPFGFQKETDIGKK